ncbi:MAG: hypothetical protein AAGJ52_01600, partial [Pseudomonadota bacterium]
MSLRVTLEFTENDLEHFRSLAKQAVDTTEKLSREEIIEGARELLKEVDENVEADYIRSRLQQLQVLIDILN